MEPAPVPKIAFKRAFAGPLALLRVLVPNAGTSIMNNRRELALSP